MLLFMKLFEHSRCAIGIPYVMSGIQFFVLSYIKCLANKYKGNKNIPVCRILSLHMSTF